ncbi:xanthine dehydrogenase family protein molybdopterin-binding subunit [Kibdelosporangium philippinense]|uniref:Xanthine dehydrogenase family protein molybdopterin-binding subunit n=1 Tax=Kibdelosporangium philippinense TaxID=211113 RepID=A0ABS8ZTH0_9PSEU|nr:xanthine dehydrogenase family protein molybdopterin-binding subunit [Kibdelosporangium philippinense]MCE7010884.1 xanthine dehydrogenase family protein molybdopterin-binding subunit [Kibdelosporangium philippinense]
MADKTAGHVGDRRARFDMRGRVRGALGHVADQAAGPCAHVAVHRSTQPHATIRAVHVEDALAMDGVYAVATGADLYKQFGDRLLTGPAFADQPALAYDKVRYVGEPIAAVLAADLATARAAVDAIYIDYDELDPIYDLKTALAGKSFVHEELKPSAVFGDLRHLRGVRDTNVNYEYNLRTGDAKAEGPHTVRGEFWAPPTHHVPIELPCTVAWVEGDRLEMLTTTQTPSYVRQTISDLLDVPLSRVRVMTRPLGGSFGAKMYDRLEPLAAALAWLFQRKVRIVASREEAFLLTTRHGAAVTSSLTADENGELIAANADVAYDTGAFADVGPRITAKSGMIAAGPYKVANATIHSRCVYTNKPSAGPFRGFGVPQVTWSHETLIDELAHELGEDPYRFRLRHLLREGDIAPMGTKMHSADFVGCLDAVAEAIDWDAPLDRGTGRIRRGKGVAVGVKAVLTPTIANAVLQLNQDGSATLMISTVDMGQGSDTIMAQIVADVLELDSARVHVVKADTDVTPYDTITAGSRSTYHTGNAVRRVAEAMRAKLTELFSGSYDPAGIPELIRGHFGARGATVTTEANYTSSWVPYDKETGRSEKVTEHWFAGAVGVKISVDTATGRVKIDHLAVAGDVGKAINPLLVEQQLSGAAIMGIGHALFDQLVIDQGQLINGTLLDYQLPSIRDLPERLTPIVVESPHTSGPFGAKGVGETGILGVAPAIGNAIRDALGIRLTKLPMTPESIVAALEERS